MLIGSAVRCALQSFGVAATLLATVSQSFGSPESVDLSKIIVRDEQGGHVALSDLVSETTALHFWATWCGPCRIELPKLDSFAEILGPNQMLLISVDTTDYGVVSDFLTQLDVAQHSLQAVGAVGTPLAILGFPATLVVQADGTVLLHHVGPLDWADADVLDLFTDLLSAD